MKILLLYLPVLHQGYLDLIDRHQDLDEIWVIGEDLLAALDDKLCRKDLRRLEANLAAQSLRLSLKKPVTVKVIGKEVLLGDAFQSVMSVVINQDELLVDLLTKLNFPGVVTCDQAFLRWDKKRIQEPENFPCEEVSISDFRRTILAQVMSKQSVDWWLQVGAVIGNAELNGFPVEPFGAWNHHHEDAPSFFGDVRLLFEAGQSPEMNTSIHAEAALIARSARKGIKLEGASIYSTVFPCPVCARLIAEAGFARCYFVNGYSTLLGAEVLRKAKVKIVRVMV